MISETKMYAKSMISLNRYSQVSTSAAGSKVKTPASHVRNIFSSVNKDLNSADLEW